MAAPLLYQMNLIPSTKSENISIKNKTDSRNVIMKNSYPPRTVSPDHVQCFDDHTSTTSQQEKASKNIPIQHHIRRTESEIQLQEDEVMADYRDYCMYQRIVSGIVKKQQEQQTVYYNHGRIPREGEDTLRNIIRTRNSPVPGTEQQQQEQRLEQPTSAPQWPLLQPRIQQPQRIMDDDDYALSYDDMEQLSCPPFPSSTITEREEDEEMFVLDL